MGLFQKQNSQSPLSVKLKLAFSLLMLFVYFGFGLFLIIKGWHTLSISQNISIGILLILYSIFRAYRLIRVSGVKEGDDELLDN